MREMNMETYFMKSMEWNVLIFVVNSPADIDMCMCAQLFIITVHGNAKQTIIGKCECCEGDWQAIESVTFAFCLLHCNPVIRSTYAGLM